MLGGAAQALPQVPQFASLVARSTHESPQSVWAPQFVAHSPLEQTSPPWQVFPQVPQLAAEPWRSTQLPLQLVWPCGQHRPSVHVPAQAEPHLPQLARSVLVSKHLQSHSSSWPWH